MTSQAINRRGFLGTTAATAVAGLMGSASAQAQGANDTIRVGLIGAGGRGTQDMTDCIEYGSKYNSRVTAVCDIWESRRAAAAKRIREAYGIEPKAYNHIDKLFNDKDIDAVIIATADHQHAKMLEQALKAGKDVYCEKPMANVLSEANSVLAAGLSTGRVVQLGTQGRSHPKCRAAADMVRKGMIGEIVKFTMIENEYSPYRWARKPADLEKIHETDTNWREFLFGKPNRPFDPKIYLSYRLFREFSSGIFDQWMSHAIDTSHFLTNQLYPTSVVAHGGIYQWRDYRENPDTVEALLEYGQGDKKFLVTYASCLVNGAGMGYHLQGTLGSLVFDNWPLVPGGNWTISGAGVTDPKAMKESVPITEKPGTLHHMANWLDCVRRRDREGAYCPIEAGYGHSIACIMATDAYWSGKRMVFDSTKKEIHAG
jgi:predicted dehydrogenase